MDGSREHGPKSPEDKPGDPEVEASFDGRYITMEGQRQDMEPVIDAILGMNPDHNLRSIRPQLFDAVERQSDFNGDILTPDGKMIRMLLHSRPDSIEISLGGGGNTTPPETMVEEIEKATGLELVKPSSD